MEEKDYDNAELSNAQAGEMTGVREKEFGKIIKPSRLANRAGEDQVPVIQNKPGRKQIGGATGTNRKVEVAVNSYHRCKVGPQWYDFYPDKTYSVPENVKNILLRAGKLAAR